MGFNLQFLLVMKTIQIKYPTGDVLCPSSVLLAQDACLLCHKEQCLEFCVHTFRHICCVFNSGHHFVVVSSPR